MPALNPLLTKPQVANIRKELDAALRTVARITGVDFKIGIIRFDSDSLRCKIEGTRRGAAGTSASAPVDPRMVALHKMSWLLGTDFKVDKTYHSASLGNVKFVGYNSRARSYPYIVQQVKTGKKFKLASFGAQNIVAAGWIPE